MRSEDEALARRVADGLSVALEAAGYAVTDADLSGPLGIGRVLARCRFQSRGAVGPPRRAAFAQSALGGIDPGAIARPAGDHEVPDEYFAPGGSEGGSLVRHRRPRTMK